MGKTGANGRDNTKNTLFYADCIMLASSDPGWLQGTSITLVGLAALSGGPEYTYWEDGREGLPPLSGSGHPVGCGVRAADDGRGTIILEEAAIQGSVFGVWGVDGVRVAGNTSTEKNRKIAGGRRYWGTTSPGKEPRTYNMVFLTTGIPSNCTIEGCRVRAVTQMAIQVHFIYQHDRDTVIILEEGSLPHPRYPWCDMLLTWKALNEKHNTTTQCAKGAERKRQRLAKEDRQESTERTFWDYVRPLETVTLFKYLGHGLTATDEKWTVVVENIFKNAEELGMAGKYSGTGRIHLTGL